MGAVLHDIHLQIAQGEHTVILGANGSGKSTLMKLFSNDIYPSSKTPYTKKLFGQENWNIWELKEHLGIITNDLHADFASQAKLATGLEVVLSGFFGTLGLFGHLDISTAQRQKAEEAMALLEIAYLHDTPVRQMSTGQLRRCIIARAMVYRPQALLLDEPTSGLDIKAQLEFVSLIQRLSEQTTIILITHHVEEIFPQVKHVILLKEGRIYKQGDKASVLRSRYLSDIFDINLKMDVVEGRYSLQKRY